MALVAAVLLTLAGCATKPAAKKESYVFYPPSPEIPRLQFLTSFGSEEELRGNKGDFVKFVTGAALAKNPIVKPYGIAIRQNKIYVCDTGLHVVLVLDLVKKNMRAIAPRGEGQIREPINLAVDDDGTLYVVDTVRNQVLIFDKDENLLAAIGAKDEMKPRDVVVTKDRFYVADSKNHAVRVYDKVKRDLVSTFPRDKEAEAMATKLFQPTNLALDGKGNIYVGDTGAFRVAKYTLDGKFQRTFGQNGDGPGQFKMLKGVAADHEGRVFGVDNAHELVQTFDDQGRLLMWFGQPGVTKVGLNMPVKVIVDYDHVAQFEKFAAPNFKVEYLVLVSNQFGGRKVCVFGFGHKK